MELIIPYRSVNAYEARYIQILNSVGIKKKDISERFGYKYMDTVNVLRGNSFSHVTGILNKNVRSDEYFVSAWLLKQGHSYRAVAEMAGIDANKVRNIQGVLKYKGEI